MSNSISAAQASAEKLKDTKSLVHGMAKMNKDPEELIRQEEQNYFSMLFTSLKCQDPTNPMSAQELLQSNSILLQTRMISKNTKELSEIKEKICNFLYDTLNNNTSSMVGKYVAYQGDDLVMKNKVAPLAYELNKNYSQVKLQVITGAGEIIDEQSLDISDRTPGKKDAIWVPDESIADVKDGRRYRFKVVGYENDGKSTELKTYGYGYIKSVSVDNKTLDPIFDINGHEVSKSRLVGTVSESEVLKSYASKEPEIEAPAPQTVPADNADQIYNFIKNAMNGIAVPQ